MSTTSGQLVGQARGRGDVVRLADHLDVVLAGQGGAHAVEEERVVVDEQHEVMRVPPRSAGRRGRGCRARRGKAAAVSPPPSSARRCMDASPTPPTASGGMPGAVVPHGDLQGRVV